jgi:hypothetical protein
LLIHEISDVFNAEFRFHMGLPMEICGADCTTISRYCPPNMPGSSSSQFSLKTADKSAPTFTKSAFAD